MTGADLPALVDRLTRYTENGWTMRLNIREVRSLVFDTPRDRIAFLGGAVVGRLIRAAQRQSGIRMSLSEVRAAAHRAGRNCRQLWRARERADGGRHGGAVRPVRGHRDRAARGGIPAAGRLVVIRVDRYSPSWVLGIVEKLDDGCSGAEAVALAVEGLRRQAEKAALRAAEREARAAKLEPLVDAWLCAGDMVREHREHAAEHRRYECYLRSLAGEVAGLKGEYIAIAGLLR